MGTQLGGASGMTCLLCQGVLNISALPWFTLFTPFVCLRVIQATRDLVHDIISTGEGHLGKGWRIGQGPCFLPQGTGARWLFGPVIFFFFF